MFSPFMSQPEIDAQVRDEARLYPDPDAGRHHPECCCYTCDPDEDEEIR